MASGKTHSRFVHSMYTSGDFYAMSEGWRDAQFKLREVSVLLDRYFAQKSAPVKRIADVGCGNGDTTRGMSLLFSRVGSEVQVDGFDIHPRTKNLEGNDGVSFHEADFCTLDLEEIYDLAILFDVIEHVCDPILFLKEVAVRTKIIALHIPLDDSIMGWLRNLPHASLNHPGHLVMLDAASALNLVTCSGLRIVDYRFTPVYEAPSGRSTRLQRFLYPIRKVLFSLSPYILQKTLGGTSLMVIAETQHAV